MSTSSTPYRDMLKPAPSREDLGMSPRDEVSFVSFDLNDSTAEERNIHGKWAASAGVGTPEKGPASSPLHSPTNRRSVDGSPSSTVDEEGVAGDLPNDVDFQGASPPTLTNVEEQEDSKEKRRRTNPLVRIANFLFPKVEPLPWDAFFVLSGVIAMPVTAYILLFTHMGYGLTIFYYLAEHYEQYAPTLAAALAIFLVTLYVLDFSYWQSMFGVVCRYLSYLILLTGTVVLVLFISTEYPYGPICLFAVLTPMWLVLMKVLLLPRKDTRVYVSWLSGPLFFISLVNGIVWLVWTFQGDQNEWNKVTRLQDAEESGCEPDFEDYPDCRKSDGSEDVCFVIDSSSSDIYFPENCDESCTAVFDSCLNTFILWIGPLLVSLSLFFLSFCCTFLRVEGSSEQGIINFGKLWIFLLCAMWVTASLAGAGKGLTAALGAFTLASFIGSVVFLSASFSRDDQKAQTKKMWKSVKEKYGSHLDTVRGLFIVTCAPVALVYVGLSCLNQSVRRLRVFPCSKQVGLDGDDGDDFLPAEERDWVTRKTRSQIETFRSWDRAKVYTYAIYWGIAFMTLQVIVAQFTLLFLSWLIEQTSSMSLLAATGIMVGVGLIMFLLPPVPGVPIYLTMGIVIVAIGRDTIGLVWSMVYCSAVSLALKLFACTLQQKLIGENLSHYVSVRQFVGINTRLIRAMKLVLANKGMSVAKVAILIGGPDWPTSVLCGIMRLDLFPILLGTVPIILLIIPTILTGSFTYMGSLQVNGSPEFPWAGTVATIFAALTAAVQFGSMIVAAFYLEQATASRVEELDAMPLDKEVKEADDKAQRIKKIYRDATQWHVVPFWAKSTLFLSLATMISCCYMVQLFQSECFAEYELTSTIEEDLDGDWRNLILPLGQVAMVLFFVSILLLRIFTFWANRKAVRISEGRAILPGAPVETLLPHSDTEKRDLVSDLSSTQKIDIDSENPPTTSATVAAAGATLEAVNVT